MIDNSYQGPGDESFTLATRLEVSFHASCHVASIRVQNEAIKILLPMQTIGSYVISWVATSIETSPLWLEAKDIIEYTLPLKVYLNRYGSKIG